MTAVRAAFSLGGIFSFLNKIQNEKSQDSIRYFLLQVFVKEGTLMKVSGKNRHPRHLFLVRFLLYFHCLSRIFSCTYAALNPDRSFQAASRLTISSDAVAVALVTCVPLSCIQEHRLCQASVCATATDSLD